MTLRPPRFILVLIIARAIVAGEAAADLSLEQALRVADATNESAQLARARISEVEARLREARADLLPQASLYGALYPPHAHSSQQGFENHAGEVTVEIALIDVEHWKQASAAGALVAAQRDLSSEQRRELAYALADAWLTAVAGDGASEVARLRLDVAGRLRAQIQRRVAGGQAAANDIVRQDIEVSAARLAAAEAAAATAAARDAVAEMISRPVDRALPVPAAFVVPDDGTAPEEVTRLALSTRRDLRAFARQRDAADSSARGEDAAYAPRLALRGTGVDDDTLLDPDAPVRQQGWAVGLVATWSLYDGGAHAARAAALRAQAHQVQLQRAAAIRHVAFAVADALRRLHTARLAVEETTTRRALAQINFDEAQARAVVGSITAVDLADAQVEVAAAALDDVRHRFEEARARLLLRKVIGWWPVEVDGP